MRTVRRTPVEQDVHVKPADGVWLVFRGATKESPVSTHRSEEDAMDFGRVLARAARVMLVVHARDGSVKYSERFEMKPPTG